MDNWNSFNSVFSAMTSEESSSFDDDSGFIWFKLLRKINDFYLDALHATFKEKCYNFDPIKINHQNGLSKEEFINAIDEVFGESKYTSESIAIFNEIDQNEKRMITWEEFLDFSEKQLRHTVEAKLILGEPKVLSCPHLKREAINKIVPLETKNYFCYALISKHGCVGLYDGNMNFLLSYTIIMNKEDVDKSDNERRSKKNRWITDAVFAPNHQIFIVTNSTRSLTIYDASNLHHIPLWLIIGCPGILTCLYFLDSKTKPILYSGNEYGKIITFKFHQNDDSNLFRKKHNDKMSSFYWGELHDEKDYVSIKNWGKIHQEAINDLKYFENFDCLLTCSKDSKKSILIKTKIQNYIFKIKKGVNCCYLSNKLKQLLTGSEDGSIRIFNIFVTKKPIQTIKLHKTGIIDLIILENLNYSISCSRDGFLILMDIKECVPLQTMGIKFQAFNELGKIIEWGKNSLCPGPKRQQQIESNLKENDDIWERTNILVTCCNNIVSLDLFFLDGKARNFDSSVLPPPPLQNSVLIPVNWKVSEEKPEIKCEITTCDDNLSEYIESLGFILNKDLIKPDDRNNINFKISQLESKKIEMRRTVAEGAPYLALDLPPIRELQLSQNLPIPEQRRIQKTAQKSYRLLSAASQRSLIFSSSSPSSSSRSKRSSIIEFD